MSTSSTTPFNGLRAKLISQYKSAIAAKVVEFTESEEEELEEEGIPVRYFPSMI